MSYALLQSIIGPYMERLKCTLVSYIDARLDQSGGGPGGGEADISEPAMSRSELQASSGTQSQGNIVYLSDGVSPNMYAVYSAYDTNSPASANMIVDAAGKRWEVLSLRKLLDRFMINYNPFQA